MRFFTFLLIFSTFLTISCTKYDSPVCPTYEELPATELIDSDRADAIAKAICESAGENKLIGVQVCVSDSLDELWKLSVGSVDLHRDNSLENYHVLRIGSVTKIFTAALIMKLAEDDVLSLDQKISDFYPDFEHADKISIENLLNHSSGIKDVFTIPSVFITSTNFPDKVWNPKDLAKACLSKKLNFTPGSEHSYSNTNYILLGLIAEKTAGKKAADLYREHIFEPCGLSNTYFIPFEDPPAELVTGYVRNYALSLKKWYPNPPGNVSWATVGFTAGAIASNSSDLTKFALMLFRGDILDDASLEATTDFQGKYGLGLQKFKVNDKYYYGHEGEITGFEAICAYDPSDGKVVSICCNTTPARIIDLLEKIDSAL